MNQMAPQQEYLLQLLRIALVYRLFQDRLKPGGTTKNAKARDKPEEFSRIRCPHRKWRPNTSSRWYCGDCDYPEYFFNGCGTKRGMKIKFESRKIPDFFNSSISTGSALTSLGSLDNLPCLVYFPRHHPRPGSSIPPHV